MWIDCFLIVFRVEINNFCRNRSVIWNSFEMRIIFTFNVHLRVSIVVQEYYPSWLLIPEE